MTLNENELSENVKKCIEKCKGTNDIRIIIEKGKAYHITGEGVEEISIEEAKNRVENSIVSSLEIEKENYNYFYDLVVKMRDHRNNKTSEFGEKVKITIENFKSTLEKQEKGYYGDISFDIGMIGEQTEKIYFENNKVSQSTIRLNGTYVPHLINEEYLTLLIESAYSGIYTSPYDRERIYNLSYELGWSKERKEKPYYCEICEERFATCKEFLDHLRETGHKDSMFDQYPYFSELIEIKEKWNKE